MKRGLTDAVKRAFRRRIAIEPVLCHYKRAIVWSLTSSVVLRVIPATPFSPLSASAASRAERAPDLTGTHAVAGKPEHLSYLMWWNGPLRQHQGAKTWSLFERHKGGTVP